MRKLTVDCLCLIGGISVKIQLMVCLCVFTLLSSCEAFQIGTAQETSSVAEPKVVATSPGQLLLRTDFGDQSEIQNIGLLDIRPIVWKYHSVQDSPDSTIRNFRYSGTGIDYAFRTLPVSLKDYTLYLKVKVTDLGTQSPVGLDPMMKVQTGEKVVSYGVQSWKDSFGLTKVGINEYVTGGPGSGSGSGLISEPLQAGEWYELLIHVSETDNQKVETLLYQASTKELLHKQGFQNQNNSQTIDFNSVIEFGTSLKPSDLGMDVRLSDFRLYSGVMDYSEIK